MHLIRKGHRKGQGLHFSRRRKRISAAAVREILIWAGELALVVFLAYFLVVLFGWRTNMAGSAMEPTLYAEDQILVNKFSYMVSHPRQGDVILFLPNGNEKSHYYTRRVIAVPGDTVQIADGRVYVNGEEYELKHSEELPESAGIAGEEITLGEDEYFVLGDNINQSEDSRYTNIGNIKEEDIIGKVWFRFSSLRSFGFIK